MENPLYSTLEYAIIGLFEIINKFKNAKESLFMSLFSKYSPLLLSTAVLTIGVGSCSLSQENATADELQATTETTATTDWVEPEMDAKTKADTDWVMSQLAEQNPSPNASTAQSTQESGSSVSNTIVQNDTGSTEVRQTTPQVDEVSVNQQLASTEAVYTEPQSTTSQTYTNGLRQFEAASDAGNTQQEKTIIQQLSSESERLLAANQYSYRQDPDMDTTTYDVNHLPQEVREEMTTYAVGLINQLRDAMGVTRAQANRDMVKLAQEVAREYLQSGFTAGGTRGHYEAGIKKVAERHHLMAGQYYENLNTEHDHDTSSQLVTRKDLRKSTHDAIMTFLYNGYEYDHAVSIAGINFAQGTGGLREFGIAFSQAGNKRRIHLLGLNELLMLDGSDIRLDNHIDPDEYRGTVAHPKKTHEQNSSTSVAQTTSQTTTQSSRADNSAQMGADPQPSDYRIINTHWGDVSQLNQRSGVDTSRSIDEAINNQSNENSDQTVTTTVKDPVVSAPTVALAGLPETGDRTKRMIASGLLIMLVGLFGFEMVAQTNREKKRQKRHSFK